MKTILAMAFNASIMMYISVKGITYSPFWFVIALLFATGIVIILVDTWKTYKGKTK